jgi:iron complex outermembrane receptor protein
MRSNTYVKLALTLACALGAGSAGFGQAAPAPSGSTPAPTNTNVTPNAQDDEDAVVREEFQVQGAFAGSLAMAAEMKQSTPSITEVIAAEDFGKLPDVSIADSLTRLTGLTTQRQNGRSQAIVIRGLTGDFSTGLLNGREQASPNLNRTVEFDQYPADLLNEVVVYKTAEASLTSQGIAGSIDLRTVSPLSKTGRVAAVSAYYEWLEYGELTPGADATGHRINLSYVDQFQDGKLGIAFGLSLTSKPFAGKQFQAWGYPTDSGGNYALGGTKSYVRNNTLDRDGAMLVIEHKPNDNIHQTFDLYISDFTEKQLLRGMEIPLAFWSGAQLQSGYTVEDGLITDARLTNVQPVVRNDVFERTDSPISVGYNLIIGEKGEWPVTFDIGYSQVERDDKNLETWSGLGFRGTVTAPATPDTMRVQLRPGNTPIITSTLDYESGSILRLSDPQGWGPTSLPGGGMHGYYKQFSSLDAVLQASLGTSHKLDGFFNRVAFGMSYNDRYKRDGEKPSGFIHPPTNASGTLPLPAQVGTTDMSFLGLGKIYAYDPLKAFNDGVWGYTENLDTGIVARRYEIWEKIMQLYAQADMKTKVGEMDLTGSIGVRYIMNQQESEGLSGSGNQLNAVSDEADYDQFAPNLALNLQITDNSLARFSIARQIARPRMYDLRAARTWGYNPALATSTDPSRSPWSGDGGNTQLKPWESDSLDLSYEYYFKDNRGYIAVAGFYKDLKNYIYQENTLADFTGYPVLSGPDPVLWEGIVSQPVNGEGGSLKGLEFTLSLPSEVISESIKGFGLVFGYAMTESSIKPWGPSNPSAPISGLSEDVSNITLYYENYGFSARVSQRYRSENRQWLTNFGPPSQGGDVNPNGGFSYAKPETVTDAQISYTFKSEKMKNLTLFLQAYNLTDEPLVTYNNSDPRQVINYQTYGASYSFGASMKF